MADGTGPVDPRAELVARAIVKFDWHNYRLDDVGEIRWREADYARELAKQILAALATS